MVHYSLLWPLYGPVFPLKSPVLGPSGYTRRPAGITLSRILLHRFPAPIGMGTAPLIYADPWADPKSRSTFNSVVPTIGLVTSPELGVLLFGSSRNLKDLETPGPTAPRPQASTDDLLIGLAFATPRSASLRAPSTTQVLSNMEYLWLPGVSKIWRSNFWLLSVRLQ